MHNKFVKLNFYIGHLQYVDLLRDGPRNKVNFSPSFTLLSVIRKQLLRAALEKSCSHYPGLLFVKHL